MMNKREIYTHIFMDIFNVEESALDETFTFKDVAVWNSLTHLTLISELEVAFDIMFETEDILHFGGYENGKKILSSKYGVSFKE